MQQPTLYALDDPAIKDLHPWFAEIFEAAGSLSAVRQVLRKRWPKTKVKGLAALRTKIVKGDVQHVIARGGKAFLTVRCPQVVRRYDGNVLDRTCDWLIAPPVPAQQIAPALRKTGLRRVPALQHFYEWFNGSELSSGPFCDCRKLPRLCDYFAPEAHDEILPLWPADAYREVIRAERAGRDFEREPSGGIDPREWFVLNEANKDFLVMNREGFLGWLLHWDEMYLLNMKFEEFLVHYARIGPMTGGGFMWDLFGGNEAP